jgi:hypothetical protein
LSSISYKLGCFKNLLVVTLVDVVAVVAVVAVVVVTVVIVVVVAVVGDTVVDAFRLYTTGTITATASNTIRTSAVIMMTVI